MAAAFALVSKNQTLKLAFNSLLFSLVILWWRETGGFWLASIILCFLSYNYFRPIAGSGRFLVALLTIGTLPFIFPPLGGWEIYFALFVGALTYTLIGIKDLLFVNRKIICQALYFLISGVVIYLYLLNPTTVNQIGVFIFLTVLLRELYNFLIDGARVRALIISLVYSLLALEFGWVTSLLPIHQLSAAALITAALFIIHDLTVNYSSSELPRRLIVRDLTAFFVLAILVFALSPWNLV